jgi:hypothetical protein
LLFMFINARYDPTLVFWLEAADYDVLKPSAWNDHRSYGPDSDFTTVYLVTSQGLSYTKYVKARHTIALTRAGGRGCCCCWWC